MSMNSGATGVTTEVVSRKESSRAQAKKPAVTRQTRGRSSTAEVMVHQEAAPVVVEPVAEPVQAATLKKAQASSPRKSASRKSAARTANPAKADESALLESAPVALEKPVAVAVKNRKGSGATTSKATSKAAKKTCQIHQIYFSSAQLEKLDVAFTPLDNAGHDDVLREFSVFERLSGQAAQKKALLWGALSWKFTEKTGLTGAELRAAIDAQPGFDLYFCNPYPEHEALYINGWQQGVVSHPAFTELCAEVLSAAGLDRAEVQSVQSSQGFSTCNYFVASPAFWNLYLPWVRATIAQAREKLPAAVLKVLDSRLSDPTNQHPGATYWPFIVERLLPQFLRGPGRDLKICKLALPAADARLNGHLLRLREMKDVAHRTRSRWMYACWLNYRNLYLMQKFGKAWCQRFLPLISVSEAEFW